MTLAMFHVVVVEDDEGLRSVLRTLLEANGYRVSEAATGERGVLEAKNHRPDLMMLDLGLPDHDGVAVIAAIRAFSPVPILVLTARTLESEKVAALDAGADDYVTKPFGVPELLARVRAVARRAMRGPDAVPLLQFGAVSIDLTVRAAQGPQGPLHLTPLEFRVLDCLTRRLGLVVTQRDLIREAWGPDRSGDASGLRSYIRTLRQKLEPDPHRPRYLITEVGVGYRLLAEDPPAA